MGGSLGAVKINNALRKALPSLLKDFQIIHLCGKGNADESLMNTQSYKQFEYVKAELKDLFAMADVVISRAGANAICELLALKKPNLLIPLVSGSRGDQILNAKSFEAQGFSMVLSEDDITETALTDKVHELFFTRQTYVDNMEKSNQLGAIATITGLIEEIVCDESH